MTKKVPELLAPAGSLEKLKIAISYGANAVYCGGQDFGLRTAADNLTYPELIEGVDFAHQRGAKVYVVLNSFLHDKDLDALVPFVEFLNSIQVDAVIVSDLGVIETVKKYSDIPIHLSTQASCLNIPSAKLWQKMGIKRVIVGRELSIEECSQIKKATNLEVEMFIHGSMCMAYSGHCTISNYTQGRDSNRGGCAHSCRFEYSLDFKNWQDEQTRKAYFMSSKDLNGLEYLPQFCEMDIDSIKIEGRMKSALYAGTVSKVYREALDYYQEHGNLYSEQLINWASEMNKFSHRSYTSASLMESAGADSIYDGRESEEAQEYVSAGNIIEVKDNQYVLVQVRRAFCPNDDLEVLPFSGEAIKLQTHEIFDLKNNKIEKTNPSTIVKLPFVPGVCAKNIVRQRA